MLRKIKRWIQLRTIRFLTKNLPKGSWWLGGGWAIEAITGVPSLHGDIDVYVREGVSIKGRFLDIHILHEEEQFFVEKSPHGTFWFSKEVFGKKSEYLHGIPVNIVNPELLYAFAKASPHPRTKEKQYLLLLQDFVNPNKIEGIIKYQPTTT